MVLVHSGRLSAKQLARDRKRTEREIRRDARAGARTLILTLRARIKSAKASRKSRLVEVREHCKIARAELRERQRVERIAFREQQRGERQHERATCRANVAGVRSSIDEEVSRLKGEIDEVRSSERENRNAYALGVRLERDTRTRAERRAEEEDHARRELPAELVPVFEHVKSKIRSSPRMSLAEAFLQWAHDHSGQVAEILYADERAHLAELERDERSLSREYARWVKRGGKPSAKLREQLEAAGYLERDAAPVELGDDEEPF